MIFPPFPFMTPFYKKPFAQYYQKTYGQLGNNNSPYKSEKKIDNEIPLKPSFQTEPNKLEQEKDFNFFGIKLSSDDLLLIYLLYFLYEEDVKDTYLYIALILLLLS